MILILSVASILLLVLLLYSCVVASARTERQIHRFKEEAKSCAKEYESGTFPYRNNSRSRPRDLG